MKNGNLILLGVIIAVILTVFGLKMVMEKSQHDPAAFAASKAQAKASIDGAVVQLGQLATAANALVSNANNIKTSLTSTATNVGSMDVSGHMSSSQAAALNTAIQQLDAGCAQIESAKLNIIAALNQTSGNQSYMATSSSNLMSPSKPIVAIGEQYQGFSEGDYR